jgi:hypothetical protein
MIGRESRTLHKIDPYPQPELAELGKVIEIAPCRQLAKVPNRPKIVSGNCYAKLDHLMRVNYSRLYSASGGAIVVVHPSVARRNEKREAKKLNDASRIK